MLKKVISTAVLLCFVLCINVMSENSVNDKFIPDVPRQAIPGNMDIIPTDDMQGMIPPMPGDNPNFDAERMPSASSGEFNPSQNPWSGNQNQHFDRRMPGDMGEFPGNMTSLNKQTQNEQPKGFWNFVKTYSTPIASVILLAFAFVFVIFYRRKNY